MHRLIAPAFLDLRVMNSRQHEATVITNSSVRIEDEIFHLADPSEISLHPSQKVYVHLSRHFYLETEEEQKEKQRQAEERRQREKEEDCIRRNKQREEAKAFNTQLHIPVKWASGFKDVLSGITDYGRQDGRNKTTVNHILLQEDLEDGRLQRKKGDFLCSSSSKQNGKRWLSSSDESAIAWFFDGDGNGCQGQITCKACLQIAKRWK
jgi:hypothetical protein